MPALAPTPHSIVAALALARLAPQLMRCGARRDLAPRNRVRREWRETERVTTRRHRHQEKPLRLVVNTWRVGDTEFVLY